MATSRSGMVAGAVVLGLVLVWLFRLGGAQVPDPDPHQGHHGTPAGWRFSWPAGDPERGREVFLKY